MIAASTQADLDQAKPAASWPPDSVKTSIGTLRFIDGPRRQRRQTPSITIWTGPAGRMTLWSGTEKIHTR